MARRGLLDPVACKLPDDHTVCRHREVLGRTRRSRSRPAARPPQLPRVSAATSAPTASNARPKRMADRPPPGRRVDPPPRSPARALERSATASPHALRSASLAIRRTRSVTVRPRGPHPAPCGRSGDLSRGDPARRAAPHTRASTGRQPADDPPIDPAESDADPDQARATGGHDGAPLHSATGPGNRVGSTPMAAHLATTATQSEPPQLNAGRPAQVKWHGTLVLVVSVWIVSGAVERGEKCSGQWSAAAAGERGPQGRRSGR